MAYQDSIFQKIAINEILVPGEIKVSRTSERKIIHATGKREPYASFPGQASITGNIKFNLGEGLTDILDLVLSDENGAMQEVEIDDGNKLYTAYFTSATITVPTLDVVEVSLDFIAKSTAVSNLPEGDPILSNPFIGANISLTGFPSTIDFESIEIKITNSVSAKYTAKGTSRLPSHLAQGYMDIEADIKFNEDTGIDILGSLSKVTTGTVVIKSANGLKTLTITMTNLLAGESPREVTKEDIVKYGLTYSAETIAFTVA